MMLSKNAGSLPDDRAHVIRTTATAAAARITSAYSAVVWPACAFSSCRRTRRRTYHARNILHLLPCGSAAEPDRLALADGAEGRDQDRHDREEEEGGEDEEHEGEEHLDRRHVRRGPSRSVEVHH